MDIQTFYPVFENGQVLTSQQLNDIVDYLEPQDRLTRTKLIGIGIACGFAPNWDAAAGTLTLSKGAAVTSEGYLIAEDEAVFDRFRPYSVLVPTNSDATADEKAAARYPFLFDGDNQREAFELLPDDFEPAPGDPEPIALSAGFVTDKTLMLFIECNLEALKNCDINDCADKGAAMNVTLRRLLITREVADQILAEEALIAERPVDRANHPRRGLATLSIEKINPGRHQIANLSGLYQRIFGVAADAGLQLQPAMQAAWNAYRPLLVDMYPPNAFPNGPFPKSHFLNMLAAFAETPTLIQYFYDAMHDLIRSYNEFIEAASRFDAECCPHEGRFPKHVLAGDVLPRPTAFAKAPISLADFDNYDPLDITGGPAPEGTPAARRHHFVPAFLLDGGHDALAELRALFARLVLLAQTYATRNLLDADIRLTPSRNGAAPLGERALPFYYRFQPTGDLFRNWSWRKARSQTLGTIHAYAFNSTVDQSPLLFRQDDQDFIRVEGIVGKPLGTAMATLIEQKAALGVSFGIEPVWIDYGIETDAIGGEQALEAMRKLFLCRLRDLDVIFLMMMAALFAFMVWLIQVLGRLDATKTTVKGQVAGVDPTIAANPVGGIDISVGTLAGSRSFGVLDLKPEEQVELRATSDRVLTSLRTGQSLGADIVKQVATAGASDEPLQAVAVASIYELVRNPAIGGELIDRVRAATAELGLDGDPDELTAAIYPSVALIARAEEMMQATSAASIAEFDEAAFSTAFNGFADAYATYAGQAETDPVKTDKEITDVNTTILANNGPVAATAAQLSGAGITAELQKRLLSIFQENVLQGYARRHPGIEHKAGVPVGGTLVLVYGMRGAIQGGLQKALSDLGPAFEAAFNRLTAAKAPALDINKAIDGLLVSSKPQTEDVLDEFVVLADFCLPYHCCDTDCSEIEIERRVIRGDGVVKPGAGQNGTRPIDPKEPDKATGVVDIAIVQRQSTGREVAFKSALLMVTDLADGKVEEEQLKTATLKKELPPGKYRFEASSPRQKSEPIDLALGAGAAESIRLVLL